MNQNTKFIGWKRVLLFVFPYMFIVGFFQYFGASIVGLEINASAEQSTLQHVVVTIFDFLGTFLVIFLFMKFVDKRPFVDLGFSYNGHLKDIIFGISIGAVMTGLGYYVFLQLNQIEFEYAFYSGKDLLLTFVIFLLVAIIEESLLRGYVQRNLMSSMNKYIALVITALLFAMLHLANPYITIVGFINLFLAGILLGLPYAHTKNLWFPISLHFSWNFFQSFLGFNVSGQDAYSYIEIAFNQKNTFNGGDFCFEGSTFSLGIQTILILILFIYLSRRKWRNQTSVVN